MIAQLQKLYVNGNVLTFILKDHVLHMANQFTNMD